MTRWHVVSRDEFDDAFSHDALIAELPDDTSEQEYVERDTRLLQQIKDACRRIIGADADGVVVGSAIVNAVRDNLDASGRGTGATVGAVRDLVRQLAAGVRAARPRAA